MLNSWPTDNNISPRLTTISRIESSTREIEKPVNDNSKKSSATVKVQVWEIRAIRIAKLDRAVEVNPSTDIPADDPAF